MIERPAVVQRSRKSPPMYCRAINLSRIQGQSSRLTDDDILTLQEFALTLIPEILRPRDETGPVYAKPPLPDSKIIRRALDYSRPFLPLTASLTLNIERQIASGEQTRTKCHPFSLITRGWKYGSVPTPEEYTEECEELARQMKQKGRM